jgi:hypothetical protein
MTKSLDKSFEPKQNIKLDADKTDVNIAVLYSWCLFQDMEIESNKILM